MSSNTQKAVKGLSSQTIVTIAIGIVEIVSFSIMSRLLTKEDFGLFAAVSAIIAVFSSISEAGLGASIVQRKNLDKRFTDNVFSLSLIMGSALTLLLILLSGVLSIAILGDGMRKALILMSVTLLMHSLSSVNISLLQRNYRFITIGVINIVSLVISTGVAVALALQSYGFYAIIARAVISPIIVYVISYFCVKPNFTFQLDKEYIKDIVNFSGWFMASRLLRNLSKQLDKLLMPRLLGVETLGAYSRPKDFIEQFSGKINGIFDTALFPVLSSIQDDYVRLRSSLSKSLYYLNLFSTFLALGFIFNSKLIIRVFFGADWLELVPVFIILSIAIVFNADGRLADCYYRSLGYTKQQFYFRIGELVAKFLGVIVGVRWGLIGVAVGVTVSESVLRVTKLLYITNIIGIANFSVVSWFITSWRPILFVLPICTLFFIFLPQTLVADFLMTAVFVLTCLVPLLFFPGLVGGNYKDELYPKVMVQVKKKLRIK